MVVIFVIVITLADMAMAMFVIELSSRWNHFCLIFLAVDQSLDKLSLFVLFTFNESVVSQPIHGSILVLLTLILIIVAKVVMIFMPL